MLSSRPQWQREVARQPGVAQQGLGAGECVGRVGLVRLVLWEVQHRPHVAPSAQGELAGVLGLRRHPRRLLCPRCKLVAELGDGAGHRSVSTLSIDRWVALVGAGSRTAGGESHILGLLGAQPRTSGEERTTHAGLLSTLAELSSFQASTQGQRKAGGTACTAKPHPPPPQFRRRLLPQMALHPTHKLPDLPYGYDALEVRAMQPSRCSPGGSCSPACSSRLPSPLL